MGHAHLSPENLARALDMQSQCKTQAQIAVALGVHRSTVNRSLSQHNKRVFERLEKRSASSKGKQIAQLEYLAAQAVSEWQRSKLDSETIKTTSEEAGNTPDGPVSGPTKTETTIKGQTGDPALLREARGALADIRKILGLDAPPPKPKDVPDDDDYEIDLSPHPQAEEDPAQPGDGPSA